MPARATVTVDLSKVRENARRVCDALPGVDVVAVTKVTCGSPEVARAMLAGGAVGLGDSRLENLEGLREAGIDVPLWLIRAVPPALAEDCVRLADVSLASELTSVRALDAAAGRLGRKHSIVLMVDLGDLREGVMPAEVSEFLEATKTLEHVEVVGLGVSLTCFGAVVPTKENLGLLVELDDAAEAQLGRRLLLSGGMSSTIDLAADGELPPRIDNLRVGESVLLGVSTVTRERILGLHTDAITVAAPVIECKVKPTMPTGIFAQDAFGQVPCFTDDGLRRRAILGIGRQDVAPEGLRPIDPRVRVLGASSDHLIVDVDDLPEPPAIGESLAFVPNYSATLRLFTSPYVAKEYVGGE